MTAPPASCRCLNPTLMTGQKLRLLREYRNYSQEYIAEKLGITQNAYSRIENNQTRLTAERLEKLAAILDISPLELLSEREPVLQFTSCTAHAPTPAAPDEHWKEMIENTKQLYGQVIIGKDEKIALLENEISFLRKETDRFIRLLEKLTDGAPLLAST
jgi:transcriptional regulator with XRE-family HTH domain